MRLLVTRPEPEASRTAERLRVLGHEVFVAPLLEAEWLDPPALSRIPAAVLFTSLNAVRAVDAWPDAARLRPLPAFCVGGRTAESAREAQFSSVRYAEGGVEDLERLVLASLDPAGGPLLYPAAADRSGDLVKDLVASGFEVDLVEAYRMGQAKQLPDAVVAALAEGRIDGVLVYSRRTAATLMERIDERGLRAALAKVPIFAISANAAAALGSMRVHVAAAPTEAALLEAVAEHPSQASVDGLIYSDPRREVRSRDMAEQDDTTPEAERLAGKRRKRPPVTIDLEAETTAATPSEAVAATDPESAVDRAPAPLAETPRAADPEVDQLPPAQDARRSAIAGWIPPVAAAIGGGIVGGLLVAFLAAPQTDTIANASVDSRIELLSTRLDKLEANASGTSASGGADTARLDALAADIAALKETAGAPAPGSTSDLAPLESRLSVLEQRPAATTDLTPLQSRIEELAGRLGQIETHPPSDPKTEAAARMIALTALRQAAESGAPFQAEFAAAQSLGVDTAALAPLATVAAAGAPSAAALRSAFPAVAERIRAASMKVDPEAGLFDRLAASAGSLVTVKPAGPVDGSSTTAIVSRMEADVAKGDLAAALQEGDALDAAAKAPFGDWADGARRRIAIDAALAALAAAPAPSSN